MTANIAGCARSPSRASAPDGELVGFIGVGSDITLAKHAELELRREVEERTAQLAATEAQFRAVFEAALEVMVLLEPDGTVLAVNNRREAWRHEDPSEAVGQKLWDAPTMQAYPQHIPVMRKGIATAARGKVFTTEVKMEREGSPTSYLDVSVQPVRGEDGDDRLSAVRSARHHRPQGRAGAAAPEPEDGGAGPAHRRHRPRLQQSADGRRRRPRHHRQARRRPEAQALCRKCARRRRARRAADRPAARVQPGPAARGPPDPSRAADREHAAAAAQRAWTRASTSNSSSTRR